MRGYLECGYNVEVARKRRIRRMRVAKHLFRTQPEKHIKWKRRELHACRPGKTLPNDMFVGDSKINKAAYMQDTERGSNDRNFNDTRVRLDILERKKKAYTLALLAQFIAAELEDLAKFDRCKLMHMPQRYDMDKLREIIRERGAAYLLEETKCSIPLMPVTHGMYYRDREPILREPTMASFFPEMKRVVCPP